MSSHPKQPVISLSAYREVRDAKILEAAAVARYRGLSKLELLEEMVLFQEKRSALGALTPQMMVEGKTLFQELEKNAETRELQLLTSSYRRHLECELEHYLKKSGSRNS